MRASSRVGQVEATIGPADEQALLTRVAIGGPLVAVVLAVIGGMPFDLPMPTHLIGWVEPTCGLTRGSTAIVRGDVALAWRYNPASFAVMIFGVAGLARAASGMMAGRWLNVDARIRPLGWIALFVGFVLLGLHQQSNAQFVMDARL